MTENNWGLYWVTPALGPEDNCFVVARSSEEAIEPEVGQHEKDFITAERVLDVPAELQEPARMAAGETKTICFPWPGYATDWLIHRLHGEIFLRRTRVVHRIAGREFERPGLLEATFGKPVNLAESVKDLLDWAQGLEGDGWIFRGQRDAYWTGTASIRREPYVQVVQHVGQREVEIRSLRRFKREAQRFLDGMLPANDWEWLAIAQHYGVPTRLLDWTRNPLVALFFSVWGNRGDRDGVVIGFKTQRPPVDPEVVSPFDIDKIELYLPNHLAPRVAAQDALFTAEPDSDCESSPGLGRPKGLYIAADSVLGVKGELYALGMSERTLFPGLQSLGHELARLLRSGSTEYL